jgi:hypothetical protein
MTGAVNTLMGGISLTASAAPTNPSATGTGTVTTTTTTVTVEGGESPFTYLWSQVSGNAMTITAATSATTAFQRTGVIAGDNFSGTFQCLVTDNAGRNVTTNTVTATILGP